MQTDALFIQAHQARPTISTLHRTMALWNKRVPASYITFPDGDMRLRSCDGVDFRVDSVILRRASGFFRDLARLPEAKDTEEVIAMEESADVLNILLRLLYPMGLAAPTVSTHKQGEELLRAVDKLDIVSHAVNQAITQHLSTLVPLRAWAIAVRFQYAEARKAAVARFMLEKPHPTNRYPDIAELDGVSARALAKLYRVRETAIHDVKEFLSELFWCCAAHSNSDWASDHMSEITVSPFDLSKISESAFEDVLHLHADDCTMCWQRFNGAKSTRRRALSRAYVTDRITNAPHLECSSHGCTVSVCLIIILFIELRVSPRLNPANIASLASYRITRKARVSVPQVPSIPQNTTLACYSLVLWLTRLVSPPNMLRCICYVRHEVHAIFLDLFACGLVKCVPFALPLVHIKDPERL